MLSEGILQLYLAGYFYIPEAAILVSFFKLISIKFITLVGAIIGDIIGSVFEGKNIKTTEVQLINPGSRFTDDTVCTMAITEAILEKYDFASSLRKWGRAYPNAGYGKNFREWLFSEDPKPYHSFGNGSAMRVSPVAYIARSIEEVLQLAKETAVVSHDHPEGIKGAQAIALSVYLALQKESKSQIKAEIENRFNYNLGRNIEEIRPGYRFDVSCQRSVPEAIIAFLDSKDYEESIRMAISLGGDADTLACMSGAIAEAYYIEIPEELKILALDRLDNRMLEVLYWFKQEYGFRFN